MFGRTRRRIPEATVRAIYGAIVAQARVPAFYADYGVPDTLEGRFELLVLHAFLYFRRMKGETAADARETGQAVFDLMFLDMDRSLRELGVGDLSVPKKIKRMAQAFYGRVAAYDAALAAGERAALADALARNIYASDEAANVRAPRLARYVLAADGRLRDLASAALVSTGPVFPSPDLVPEEVSP
jgi:cytochrome b pre-mRNA-processing protein 3